MAPAASQSIARGEGKFVPHKAGARRGDVRGEGDAENRPTSTITFVEQTKKYPRHQKGYGGNVQ